MHFVEVLCIIILYISLKDGKAMNFDKSKPYIFFSYAHKESEIGMQIIKGLQKLKFNLWYDEGIEVGTEYSDYIAEHIDGCKVFVCLMDENYIASRYCRDEINFAIDNPGIDILVIYKKELKDLNIPAGLKMRTSRYQAVFLNRFANLEKFMDSMLKADILSPCNSSLAKSREKIKFTVYEENGFEPTYEQKKKAEQIVDIYALFGIKIEAFTGVSEGPRVTRYEFRPDGGEKLSKIADLADDISLALGVPTVRMLCPIPGKMAFGIEVPNDAPKKVDFEEVFSSDEFKNSEDKLCAVLGKDLKSRNVCVELSRAPHLLLGGQTCSGKTTALNCMILSLIRNTSPDEVKLLLVDPKKCEFGVYSKSKHLLEPVITDGNQAIDALRGLVDEVDRRLSLFVENGVKDITAFNRTSDQPLCRIVVFIDEMSMVSERSPRDFETVVCQIAQKGRAAGIHIVLATSDLSTRTVTGMLKANIPTRIAFSTKSIMESRVIIDNRGAELLLLKGDMLYHPIGAMKPMRIQGAYADPDKTPEMIAFDSVDAKPIDKKRGELEQAIELAKQYGAISPSLLEHRMNVSYQKALKIIKMLDEAGDLAPSEGRGKPRKLKNEN